MARKWRLAKDQTFIEGKSKTTNDIPFEEAKRIFNEMAKSNGGKLFRYKGDVYDLEGNKREAPKAKAKAESSPKPKTRPEPKAEPKKSEATRLSYGDVKPTREVPRSMGDTKEEAPKTKAASVDGGAGLVAAGALTAAAIAARKKARTSTTTPVKKANPAPKSNGPNLSRRAALGLAPKPSATPTAAKPKATVTAPTATPKAKTKSARGGGGVGSGKIRPRTSAGGGVSPEKMKDPFGLGMAKGGLVKKKC